MKNPLVICVLGAPGSGKSTLVKDLPVGRRFHVGEAAKALGALPTGASLREDWKDILEQEFPQGIQSQVILDGFPRSPEQAEWLLTQVEPSQIAVVWISLDRDASVRFQVWRDGEDSRQRAEAKYHRYLAADVPGCARLAAAGVRITQLARRTPGLMTDETYQRVFGVDLQALPWDWEGLEGIRLRIPEEIPWCVVHGSVYRTVFSAVLGLGTITRGADINILVPPEHLEEIRAAFLKNPVPGRVVRVGSQADWHPSLLHQRVELLYDGARVSLKGSGGALQALFRGDLIPCGLNSVSSKTKAQKIREAFPLMQGNPQKHRAPGGIPHPETGPLAAKIRQLASVLRREIPVPGDVIVPEFYPELSLYTALRENDMTWRTWLHRVLVSQHQDCRDHDPVGVATLQKWLSAEDVTLEREAHLGAHHLTVARLLVTDDLPSEEKAALRVAALLHDVGKARGQHVAGAHGGVGASLLRRNVVWVGEYASITRVAELVARHDLPGRVIKGCLDFQEPGSLPLQGLRRVAGDDSMWRLWRADVQAIPEYAWTAELEPLLRDAFV